MRLALLFALLAGPALSETPMTSQAPGLEIVPLSVLPANANRGDTEFCDHLFVETATTPGGKEAAAKGWHVTAEAALGALTAVSFVGSTEPATSGTCQLLEGNVGLFSGSQLVAVVYSSQPEKLMIGSIRPFGDGLRILSGDILPGTVADLVQRDGGLQVTAPATEEPVCNGAALIPGIETLPIDKARTLLMQSGWTPVPGDPAQQGLGWAKDLAAAGVPEVEDCSGTGFAFCAFAYSGPAGTLRVITAGEGGEDGSLPTVSSYDVTCN